MPWELWPYAEAPGLAGERGKGGRVCVGAGTVAQSSLLFLQELVGEEE